MRRYSILLAVCPVLAAASATCLWLALVPAALPAVSVAQSDRDIGEVVVGIDTEFQYFIVNESTRPVYLRGTQGQA